jgi:glycosyltransferase involved in cell wall biosynthesis
VPTGIDPARFHPGDPGEARRRLGLAADRRYLGIVATLRSWKGHLHLLDAFARLERPGWRLLIVGAGPMRDVIEARIRELGLGQEVLLAGGQEAPERWLRAMDLFCLPSYANEGVPQALIQAMMTALPVVSTPVGSIAELVRDGHSGILVPPQDPRALTGALRRLIDEPELARALGEAGLAHARRDYALPAMLDRMEQIFADVAAGAQPAVRVAPEAGDCR